MFSADNNVEGKASCFPSIFVSRKTSIVEKVYGNKIMPMWLLHLHSLSDCREVSMGNRSWEKLMTDTSWRAFGSNYLTAITINSLYPI